MSYNELLGRVVSLETELAIVKADGELSDAEVLRRIESLERELSSVKSSLIPSVVEERHSVEESADRFYVRNTVLGAPVSPILDPVAATRRVISVEQSVSRNKDMEFKVGKTVMSILASALILGSIVLFGALVYPFLSDGMKVVIMYVVSLGLSAFGFWGRGTKFKTFFTAMAGCGVSAFYVSGILSCFLFGAFGLGVLTVLTYAWVVVVAWISREKVPVFAYICYLGILVTTWLCVFEFYELPVSVFCYVICVTTLYLFNKTKEHKQDVFYFLQFPVVIATLMFAYTESPFTIMWMMLLTVIVYAVQRYLYSEFSDFGKLSLILTEAVLVVGYCLVNSVLSSWGFLNIEYVFLTGFVSIWSYFAFEDRFLRMFPVCIMSLALPIMCWGDFYENVLGFAPFVAVILVGGFVMKSSYMKGIACGYFIAYILNRPEGMSLPVFYFILVFITLEFGILHCTQSFERHIERIMFMICTGMVLSVLCASESSALLIICYLIAVLLSCAFNSYYFVIDDVTMRLGFVWNGFWMAYGAGVILDGDIVDGVVLAFFFLMVLVAFMVTGRWQLENEHPVVGLWLCVKSTAYLWMLLSTLSSSGVVTSIGFLLLAICGIVLGAVVQRKVIRLYGLALAILSVIKCVLIDIQYSSSLYRPVGLLVAGLLCFGISWIYTVVERKLKVGQNED